MTLNEPIDPCPWCDCEKTSMCGYIDAGDFYYYVYCPGCEMNGPYEELEDNAALAWNFLKRATVEWNKVKDGGCCNE